jgi:hypothetical protein
VLWLCVGTMDYADGVRRRASFIGECVTLMALGLSVLSGSLPWATTPPDAGAASFAGALFVSARPVAVSGFALRVGVARAGWLVVAAAAISALGLLLPATDPIGVRARQVQMAAGAGVIALALLHLSSHFGVIVALVCGLALMLGSVSRSR